MKNSSLIIKIYHRAKKQAEKEFIGFVTIQGVNLFDESWCDENRRELELVPSEPSYLDYSTRSYGRRFLMKENFKVLFESSNEDERSDDESYSGDNERDDASYSADKNGGIDDDYIFGEDSMLALRFRVATDDDIRFLRTIDEYNKEHRRSKDELKPAYVGVDNFLDGRRLAHLVTEGNNASLKELYDNFKNFRLKGRIIGNDGIKRIRVKPGPDPNKPPGETLYLSEEQLLASTYSQSTNWIEAGSGDLGIVAVEILSCQVSKILITFYSIHSFYLPFLSK